MAITVHVNSSTFKTTVQFALDCDAPAGEVSVVGSFNGWCAGADPLAPQDDGTRSVTVTVPFGQDVHFRYLAEDGVWFDDPDADEITTGGSVLHLSESAEAQEQGEHTRADLLPEEQVVGSDDPQAQAKAILADSEARVAEQAADVQGASSQTGPRTSAQATDPL